MNDLFEVRFETKVVVGASKLPKGMTEPVTKVVEAVLPTATKVLKEYLESQLAPEAKCSESKGE